MYTSRLRELKKNRCPQFQKNIFAKHGGVFVLRFFLFSVSALILFCNIVANAIIPLFLQNIAGKSSPSEWHSVKRSIKTANTFPRFPFRAHVVILLLVYISSLSLGWVHPAAHDHAVETSHTGEDEQDPCHIALHHKDSEKGCKHTFHITVGKHKCTLCDHLSKDIAGDATIHRLTVIVASETHLSSHIYSVATVNAASLSTRAPPLQA